MTTVNVAASEVRVPEHARAAVAQHRPVCVVSHDRPRYVILHPDDFALLSPMLERHREGRPVPVEQLLTHEDFEVLAEERDADADLAAGILESWE